MEAFKIAVCGVICAIAGITVRTQKPELAPPVTIASGFAIFSLMYGDIEKIFAEFKAVIESCGVNYEYFHIVAKLTLAAYITKFAAEVCRDCNENATAAKVELAGKVAVLGLTFPIIRDFLELIRETLNTI